MHRHPLTWLLLVVGPVLAAPVSSAAQTLEVNPGTVVFIASPDHLRTITVAGQTVVVLTRYELRIYLDGATAPMTTVDLGKPAPDARNEIVARPQELLGLPLGGYIARVAAIGPAGESLSEPSNPFARMGPPAPATNVRVFSSPSGGGGG
ncbi:MAG: hypothetical protein QN178_13990 [Armatimonadota bacterium]|nr:hypothetical protein [Armatimonadota bacterium]